VPALSTSVRVQKARKPDSGRSTWLVLGENYLPIAPIDEFLTFFDVTGSSPNTVRAYAHHLKLYWQYLAEADLDWRAATTQDIAKFVGWLRWGSQLASEPRRLGEKRKPSTINAIVAGVTHSASITRGPGRWPRSVTTSFRSSRVDRTSPFCITSPEAARFRRGWSR
jgi:hypothetical protein